MRAVVRRMCHHDGLGAGRLKGSSEFDLSLGKIIDTLRADYMAWFDRSPNFDIYDDSIVFQMDLITGRRLSELQGKRAYCRALTTLRTATTMAVREGEVQCSVQPWSPCDYTLRVNWTCNGHLAYQPLHISAISAYSLASKASLTAATHLPSHLIDRHKIEFLEIHPPSLKVLLRGAGGWNPRMSEPALALNRFHSPSDLQASDPLANLFQPESCKA